ncbi:aspartate--tRNA ligase [Telmatocola sphagniphila]|uniref:Aspartate--tRNA(Asp/Asn) ligase n=1 Tax=Telmatocola sphagniphila TaxID=1123043 RepID=A0A8E6EZF5_9BACT|nr:aspartate--tRNA ligase [Telmatocola sphagniphila]QVL33698.1 aspartate--tRNA ligase [Telmatocola sphagniphila]
MAEWQRTHTCGELRDTHIGQTVTLNGWVNTFRSYNNQVFVDLRDRYGITQIVFESSDTEVMKIANSLGREFVISATGKVSARLSGKENAKLATGKVELKVEKVRLLNGCPTPPFEITEFGSELANEDLRLQYRFLDLRRKSIQDVLQLRHRICKTIRDSLDAQGFLEVETPLLGKSTPEGARDYLVPSRVYHGEWYALPQSPQLYKQLLMVAGYDKYFQIARCLRDEDLRADRQPEFTQLDVEMSFVEMEDIFRVMENLTRQIFKESLDLEIQTPFPRLSYDDVMLRYGSDKPDLRYDMQIIDCCDVANETEFKVFKDALAAGGKVRALNAKGAAEKYSRKGLDELTEVAKTYKAKGLAWIKVEAGKFNSPIEKFLPAAAQAKLRELLKAEPGDLLLFVADTEEVVCNALGALRTTLAYQLKLYDPAKKDFKIAWVVDFPSFMYDEEEKRWVANHHPFTAPKDEHLEFLESDPGKVKAKAYDLVMNGYEVGGGSIRIYSGEVQSKVFGVLGMKPEDYQSRFGFLLDALKFGAPPHGGIALGLDRWCMMLAGTTNIRDVIAFPKNAKGRDLMTGAPASVESRQLRDLGLK